MIGTTPIKNLSKPILDVQKLPDIIVELNEQDQASISGGGLQRLQEEFAAELATLSAIALPSLISQQHRSRS